MNGCGGCWYLSWPAVSQIWALTLLWSMARVRVWNSTPMVALEPRLNSLRAKRARMRERQRAVGGRGPRAGDARPSEGAAAGLGQRRWREQRQA